MGARCTACLWIAAAITLVLSPHGSAHSPAEAPVFQRAPAHSWESLEKQFPGSFVTRGKARPPMVALTFDDVPDPRFTPRVLDLLACYHVRATFFVVGSRAAKHPAIVKRIVREGHLIANHSYSHALFARSSLFAFTDQIARTDRVLMRLSGSRPRFIRPPYGEILPKQVEWSKRHGYIIVNWDVDSQDWKSINAVNVMANIRRTLQPGSIILFHAGGGHGQDLSGSAEALPSLFKLLERKGYRPVTLDELLGQRGERR